MRHRLVCQCPTEAPCQARLGFAVKILRLTASWVVFGGVDVTLDGTVYSAFLPATRYWARPRQIGLPLVRGDAYSGRWKSAAFLRHSWECGRNEIVTWCKIIPEMSKVCSIVLILYNAFPAQIYSKRAL